MRIDIIEARRIAELARIEFDHASLEQMARELSKILDYIDQLKEVPSPESRVPSPSETTPMREDEVRASLAVNQVAENAPVFAHGFFIVPKVL